MKRLNLFILGIATTAVLFGCGSSAAILSTPIENIDNTPLKYTELTENESKNWMHLDLVKDTIPGMSVNKAYNEVIKNKKGQTVIVAVIDAGIDTKHEDLDDVIWVNKKEIPNNNIDDDQNGYVDDIYGWNFLGNSKGENISKEHFEYTRIYLEYISLIEQGYLDSNNLEGKEAEVYKEAEKMYQEELEKREEYLKSTNNAISLMVNAKKLIKNKEIKKVFKEAGFDDNCPTDPFEVSDADTMLEYLKSNA